MQRKHLQKKRQLKRLQKKAPAKKAPAKKVAPKKTAVKKATVKKVAPAKKPATKKASVSNEELATMLKTIEKAKKAKEKSVVVYTTSREDHPTATGGGFGFNDLKPNLQEAYKKIIDDVDFHRAFQITVHEKQPIRLISSISFRLPDKPIRKKS